ncbi:MAG: hypothetical protein HDT39_13730 [Lachnospiraceae bacterium]|nr:hypothetical protein [Lachnospiraceae bacterium]
MKFYNTKIIDYGNGNKQVITYKKPVPLLEKEYGEQKSEKADKNSLKYWSQVIDIVPPTDSEKFKKEMHSLYSSANRTKNEVYKLARANNWEWFVTFTFSNKQVEDRTDYASLVKKVTKYFDNWRQRKCPRHEISLCTGTT